MVEKFFEWTDNDGRPEDVITREGLSMRERGVYAQAPASERPEDIRMSLAWWAATHARGEAVRLDALPARFHGRPHSSDFLGEAETRLKIVTMYAWLAWRFPRIYPDIERAHEQRAELDAYIEQALRLGAARERSRRGARPSRAGAVRGRLGRH